MWQDYIEHNKDILGGKPVIKDTGISVDAILRRMDNRESIEDLLKAYPSLSRVQLLACISYSMRHFTL